MYVIRLGNHVPRQSGGLLIYTTNVLEIIYTRIKIKHQIQMKIYTAFGSSWNHRQLPIIELYGAKIIQWYQKQHLNLDSAHALLQPTEDKTSSQPVIHFFFSHFLLFSVWSSMMSWLPSTLVAPLISSQWAEYFQVLRCSFCKGEQDPRRLEYPKGISNSEFQCDKWRQERLTL